jgi:GT2 family glycosyltransferase
MDVNKISLDSEPLVSIIWVNYNSSKILNIVKMSLLSIKKLNYKNYELIIVDNASTDGSFEQIKSYLNNIGLKAKIIKTKHNLGFTGGNNIGFKERAKDSLYTLLINNDAILFPDSLKNLIKIIESKERIGALNGAVLNYNNNMLNNVPSFLDELFGIVTSYPSEFKDWKFKEIYETYPYGAVALLKNEAILEANKGINQIFDEEIFIYFDDTLLGLKLWNIGWKVLFYPLLTARHLGGGSTKVIFHRYHMLRSRTATIKAVNHKYKKLTNLYLYKNYLWNIREFPKHGKYFKKALNEGKQVGKILKKRYNLDLYKAPIIKLSLSEVLTKVLFSSKIVTNKKCKELLKLIQSY